MLINEIIASVECTACNAKVGNPCTDVYGSAPLQPGVVHDVRKSLAVLRRAQASRASAPSAPPSAPTPSFLSRGRDCAWCGVAEIARPRMVSLVSWDLCSTCFSNPACIDAMRTESRRQERRARMDFASPYPEQDYTPERRAKVNPLPDKPAPYQVVELDPWAKWNPDNRRLRRSERLVPCPECLAPAGKPCLDLRAGSIKGTFNRESHTKRIESREAFERNQRRRARERRESVAKITKVELPWMVLPLKEEKSPLVYEAELSRQERERWRQNQLRSAQAQLAGMTSIDEAEKKRLLDLQAKKLERERRDPLTAYRDELLRQSAEQRKGAAEEVEPVQRVNMTNEKAQGTTLELKPLTGVWRPRVIEEYLVEGMDWPWTVGQGAGEIRIYYTLAERKLWVATIALDAASPGGLSREFWKRGRGAFVAHVDTDRVLHPVEVSADHRSGGQRLRWYGVLQSLDTVQGIADFLAAGSAAEAIDLAARLKSPELQLKKPERRFTFE